MTYELPIALPHLTSADAAELERLLRAVFKDDVDAAGRWLTGYSDYFRCKPIDLLRRDEAGRLAGDFVPPGRRAVPRPPTASPLDQQTPSPPAAVQAFPPCSSIDCAVALLADCGVVSGPRLAAARLHRSQTASARAIMASRLS